MILRDFLRRLRGHSERERGLSEEISFHLEEQTAKNIRSGMTPAEARRAALIRFGGVEATKDHTRDQFRPALLQDFWRDLRNAARTLRSSPGFAFVAVTTLALAIAANTAIFSVVHGVLLRPLPFGDADGLMRVLVASKDEPTGNFSAADFLDLRQRTQSLSGIAGFRGDVISVSARPGEPEQLEAQLVTANFFDVLRASAALGRTFTETDRVTGEPLVVFSDASWTRLFSRARDVVGRTVRLNGVAHRVVGIMPPQFAWPEGALIWVLSPKPVPPSPIDGGAELTSRDVRYFQAVARLQSGVSAQQASADAHAVATALGREHPDTFDDRDIRLMSLREEIVGDIRPLLLLLEVAVGIVLLVAAGNVSGLLIARATARRHELAVRAAIGASRWHLVRVTLSESIILGLSSAAIGLLLGAWMLHALLQLLPDGVPRVEAIGLDVTVAVVMIAAALFTSVAFGLIPALQSSRANASAALASQTSRVSAGRARGRSALIVGEIALTLVLLVGAALLGRSFLRLAHVDSGFQPDHVTIGELMVPQTRYATGEKRIDLYRRAIDAMSKQPGIDAAGIGFPSPLRGTNASATFSIEGRPAANQRDRSFAYVGAVSAGYFKAMGVPLLTGQSFTDAERPDGEGVAIVNSALARAFWPGQSAIGKRISFEDSGKGPWVTIIGIVGDVRHIGLKTAPPPVLYIPYEQFPLPFTTMTIRSARSSTDVAQMMRRELAAIDPDLAFGDISALQESIDHTIEEPRFRTLVIGLFAALTLALAVVGLYGLISYSVTEHTREFGIRMALGASPRQVLMPVLARGARLGAVGVAIGLAVSLAATRLLSEFLYGVDPADPATYAAVAAAVLMAALAASYIPSRRAAGIDPLIAIRTE